MILAIFLRIQRQKRIYINSLFLEASNGNSVRFISFHIARNKKDAPSSFYSMTSKKELDLNSTAFIGGVHTSSFLQLIKDLKRIYNFIEDLVQWACFHKAIFFFQDITILVCFCSAPKLLFNRIAMTKLLFLSIVNERKHALQFVFSYTCYNKMAL